MSKKYQNVQNVQNVQDVFLNSIRKTKNPVTVFLVNGVKLQGVVTWFDNFSVLLRRDNLSQLVYKHAISTIMPCNPVAGVLGGEEECDDDGDTTETCCKTGEPAVTETVSEAEKAKHNE